MIYRHIRQEDQHMAPWAGGCTCQLAIWPPEAQYADRNFLWRISAAEATVEESDYTSLPDYERLLCTTSGTIRLQHGEKPPVLLAPYEIHHFDGGIPTHSWGQCKDFNLMYRKGIAGAVWKHSPLQIQRNRFFWIPGRRTGCCYTVYLEKCTHWIKRSP